jgi:hypothetical protein
MLLGQDGGWVYGGVFPAGHALHLRIPPIKDVIDYPIRFCGSWPWHSLDIDRKRGAALENALYI